MKRIEKETYVKPEIRTEEIELNVYGQYAQAPVAAMNPFFGLCPPCT